MKTVFVNFQGKVLGVRDLPFLPMTQKRMAKVTLNRAIYLVHSYEFDLDKMVVIITLGEY